MTDDRPAPATEDDVEWLTETETAAWVSLYGLTMRLQPQLDAQLQQDSGLSSFEYSVLSWLSMMEDRSVRMNELASLSSGSPSRLSNVVKRLEGLGLMSREPDPADGRYTLARLSETGWETVVAAAPGHVRHVRRLIFDVLTPAQVRQLAEIGKRLDERLRECPGFRD